MKNRTLFIVLCSFFSGFMVIGTMKAQEVICTTGDHFSNGSYKLSWTLGEPVTMTVSNENKTLTQGMQQSKIIVTTINSLSDFSLEISAFPNPVSEWITLKINSEENVDKKNRHLTYSLYNADGKLLLIKNIKSNETQILMKNYSPSTYILKVYNSKKEEIQSFKIIKE